jgi:hypothetical protein
MVPLGAEGLATHLAMPTRREKWGDLSLHNPLLKPCQVVDYITFAYSIDRGIIPTNKY